MRNSPPKISLPLLQLLGRAHHLSKEKTFNIQHAQRFNQALGKSERNPLRTWQFQTSVEGVFEVYVDEFALFGHQDIVSVSVA